MEYFGLPGTVRASVAFYNSIEEVDRFLDALDRVTGMLELMIPFTELVKGAELSVLENVTGKQVPQGTPLTLGVGEMVTVTQASVTQSLDIGSRLVRIETLDLVKLGVQAPENVVSDLFSVSGKSSLGSFEAKLRPRNSGQHCGSWSNL